MPQFFTDSKGKWIGSVTESGKTKTYRDGNGRLAGRVMDNKTYDSKGKYFGNGDQGQRLFKK